MFNNQEKKGAKHAVSTKAGAERRQRQLMSVRHRVHGEVMKLLRAEGQDDFDMLGGNGSVAQASNPEDVWSYDARSTPASVPLQLLPTLVNMCMNGPTDREVFQGTLLIRKILSVEKDPPYDVVTSSGVVPHLVNLLQREDYPELQFESAWALTNIAAGTSENTMMLVACGAIPRFVALLGSPNADCRDQSAWAIGNLSGEGAACRDEALSHGAMVALLNVLSVKEQPIHVLRNATWAVSNLCRCKPLPPLERVAIALPTLVDLLNSSDDQLIVDAAWGISYISDGPAERVQSVLEAGAVPRIVQLLSVPSTNVKLPAIRIIGNIAAGTDEQTQVIINSGALPAMAELLRHPKRALRKETCWTISNIAAGQPYQIEALVNSNVCIPILECLSAPELDVRKEAVWTIANITFCGSVAQVKYLVNIGVIPPLCETLRTYDPKIVTVALEAVQCFLQVGEDEKTSGGTEENIVAKQVMDCGGVDSIEQLQTHADKNVYSIALQILETFFTTEDETGPMGDAMGADMVDFAQANPTAGSGQFNF
ncbi:putative importin alpha [Leishmania major strain Friedlin]|uniref:Importin subunit alpha n=1 Tax=Leishmania major TaxID=5664 RepID=Q4Q7J1_LEIMA|nr:putative importin alpha [Leishmania major strain Friedlin]CAG9578308.1 importin_alpha_-_putative [Leishmania major strain Friedlin]CAJ06147.1 putative importin alpha [Leishmania major strain Friedlin]|eukprot:XP_001684707.1 putative importin alpha [Leishmania major strain Friedlin]